MLACPARCPRRLTCKTPPGPRVGLRSEVTQATAGEERRAALERTLERMAPKLGWRVKAKRELEKASEEKVSLISRLLDVMSFY